MIVAASFFGLISTVVLANPSPWNSAYLPVNTTPFLIFDAASSQTDTLGSWIICFPFL
jgi:hypothetical protein